MSVGPCPDPATESVLAQPMARTLFVAGPGPTDLGPVFCDLVLLSYCPIVLSPYCPIVLLSYHGQ